MPDFFVSRSFVPKEKPARQQTTGHAIKALLEINRQLESLRPQAQMVAAYYPIESLEADDKRAERASG
jgi:hypothetical protein